VKKREKAGFGLPKIFEGWNFTHSPPQATKKVKNEKKPLTSWNTKI